jgi:chorismate mutase/prephenate dehydratase
VAPIWREIMSACRALEAPTRVAYLGPAGTFSEEAALGYFGSSIARVPCASFDEVFRTTTAGAADFGVVPVENSTEGVVARSLDLFLTTPLFIIGETSLIVRHNLLRKTNSLAGITAVCAHPQALAQCHGWLSHHLPDVERRPVSSNAEGARLAGLDAGDRSHRQRARRGRVRPAHVAPAIQDDAHNRTRFAIVTHPDRHPAPRPSGHDCTSLIVSVDNKPGAVHDMLVPLKRHGVSMTRFESRPARSGQWEYYFYIDIEGHPDEPHVGTALRELREACAFFKVLGTYPDRRALTDHVQPTRRHRLRPDGRIVRPGRSSVPAWSSAWSATASRPSTTELAKRLGVIDVAAESALLAVAGSDVVIIAVPVAATEATFKAIRHLVQPHVLFMDVGSTKRDVVDTARRVLKERAGCVRAGPPDRRQGAIAGVQHADATLYAGRKVILTPLPQTVPELVQKATDVWTAMGAQVLKMTPENHDAAFAAVSHLPHLLAFAYFSCHRQQPSGRDFLSLAGPGFRDFTRIAASDPAVWRDILLANREEVLKQTQRFRHSLDALEHVMRAGNSQALEDLIRTAAEGRGAWQIGNPPAAAAAVK